jgi:hypothetical protein
MDQSTFEAADPLVDEISELVDLALNSDQLAALRQAIAKLSEAIGSRYSVGLNVCIEIFDFEQERTLPLLNTGLSSSSGNEPYRTWGDSSPQRYVIDGQIQVVPHDRCPKCWNVWDFKLNNRGCSHCDATMGDNCKILLDSDICPHCEKGNVSIAQPKCDQCGFEVDPSLVVWG